MKKGDYQTKTQAESYKNSRFGGNLSIVNLDEQEILREWMRRIKIKNEVVIDLGTGTGRVINALKIFSPKTIYALDLSKAMLSQIKSFKSLKKIVAPSDKIKLKNSVVRLVTSLHLFKHLPNINSTLAEANRVTKPYGYIIFDCLNTNSIVRLNLETCYSLTETELSKILSKNGYKLIETKYLNNFGESIYKIPLNPLVKVIHFFDKLISAMGIKTGVKIFVLAQKK